VSVVTNPYRSILRDLDGEKSFYWAFWSYGLLLNILNSLRFTRYVSLFAKVLRVLC
jgi:hypothetical protein